MSLNDVEIVAMCQRFRARAETFMRESYRSANLRSVVRLTTIASTLDWAARELEVHSRMASVERGASTQNVAAEAIVSRSQLSPEAGESRP